MLCLKNMILVHENMDAFIILLFCNDFCFILKAILQQFVESRV